MESSTTSATRGSSSASSRTDANTVLAGIQVLFAAAGIGVATYLTYDHYAKAPLACFKGLFNCQKVTQSVYSLVWHTSIPITVPGLMWFVLSGALAVWAILAAMDRVEAPDWLPVLHLLLSAGALGFVFWLVYVEFGILDAVCEWCSIVHILTLLTFIVALVRWQRLAAAAYNQRLAAEQSRQANRKTKLR
jgi:uncharacterized membrane protein